MKKQTEQKTYDIEEYRRKKKKEKRIHRIVRVSVVLLLLVGVGVGAYLYQRYDVAQLLQTAKNAAAGTAAVAPVAPVKSSGFPISLDAARPLGIKPLGSGVVLLTSDEVALFDADGKTLTQFVHGFTNPVVKIGNERVLTYDRGGYDYRLDNRAGNLYAARSANTILSGAAGHGTIFALVTAEPHYAGSVTVYDKTGTELLKWSSAEEIIDVDFSEDDSRLAVATVAFSEKGDLGANVYVFNIQKEKEAGSFSFPGALPVAISCKGNGSIQLVCDSLLGIIDADLKTTKTVPYPSILQKYEFTHQNTLLVTSNQGEISSTLTLVSTDAKIQQTTVKSSALDVCASNTSIGVLTGSDVCKYDNKLTPMETYSISNEVFDVAFAGEHLFALSANFLDQPKTVKETAENASSQTTSAAETDASSEPDSSTEKEKSE